MQHDPPHIPKSDTAYQNAQTAAWEAHCKTLDMAEVRRRGEYHTIRQAFTDGFGAGWQDRVERIREILGLAGEVTP